MNRTTLLAIPALTLLTATACNWQPAGPVEPTQLLEPLAGDEIPTDRPETPVQAASAELKTADGDALGTVTFSREDDGVAVHAKLTGLEPGSTHGMHIHEGDSCTPPDFASAGGHFAPDANDHGERGMQSHAGDLGNVMANTDGVAQLHIETDDIALSGDDSIVVRTVVLHEGRDDLESQPSGDAGPRLACGTIRSTESE